MSTQKTCSFNEENCDFEACTCPKHLAINETKKQPILVLIGGPTCSGKSTMAQKIKDYFIRENKHIITISTDRYCGPTIYHTPSLRIACESKFNSPENINEDLLINHIKILLKKEPIILPNRKHPSLKYEEETIEPSIDKELIIIVEGVHALQSEKIRNLANLKIYSEIDHDLRLINKFNRSPLFGGQRLFGVTIEESFDLCIKTVRPSEEKYTLPTKKHADLIVYKYDAESVIKLIRKYRYKSEN